MRAAPAVSCAVSTKKGAHEHTGPAENTRPSLRNGFTAYNALSPENGSFASVAPWEVECPQVHRRQRRDVRTTRLCRTLSRRSLSALPASTATRPNDRDDHDAPLWRDGMAKDVALIWFLIKRNIFYFGA